MFVLLGSAVIIIVLIGIAGLCNMDDPAKPPEKPLAVGCARNPNLIKSKGARERGWAAIKEQERRDRECLEK